MGISSSSAPSTLGGAAAGGAAAYAVANGVARTPIAENVASSAGAVWGNGLEKFPVLPKIVGAYGGRRAAQWIIETHAPDMPALLQRALIDGLGPDVGMRSRDLNKVVEALKTHTNTLARAGAEGVKKIAPQLAGQADAAAAHLTRLNEVLAEHGTRIASTALGAAGGRGVLRGVVLLAGAAGAGIGAWQGHKHADDKTGGIGYTIAGGTALAVLAGVALTRHVRAGGAPAEAEAAVASAVNAEARVVTEADDIEAAAKTPEPQKPLDLERVKDIHAFLYSHKMEAGWATQWATRLAQSDIDLDAFKQLVAHHRYNLMSGRTAAGWAEDVLENGHDLPTYMRLERRLSDHGLSGGMSAEYAQRIMAHGVDTEAFLDLFGHYAKHGHDGQTAMDVSLRQLGVNDLPTRRASS